MAVNHIAQLGVSKHTIHAWKARLWRAGGERGAEGRPEEVRAGLRGQV